MLSKEARKEHNEKFWSNFKKEMRLNKSSNGRAINWLNYPSDVKDVYIRLEADSKGARLCLDIQPKDDGIRSILWEQMGELKTVMESIVGPADGWEEFHHYIGDRAVSRIYWEMKGINYYRPEDNDALLNFFKEKLIRFDEFYQEFKEILVLLAQ
jgi:hypothetical protein